MLVGKRGSGEEFEDFSPLPRGLKIVNGHHNLILDLRFKVR